MKVRAIRPGYYGVKRKYVGDIFDISDEKKDAKDEFPVAFSKHWMKKVGEESKEESSEPQASKAKPAKKDNRIQDLDVI